jgi:hypothetical protein
MPLLAASAGGNGERVGAVRGEVVVSDVVFPVNAARGEMTTPLGLVEEPDGRGDVASAGKRTSGAIDAANSQERRAYPRITLADRSGLVTSPRLAKIASRDDDLDR